MRRGRRSARKEEAVRLLKEAIERYGMEGGVKLVREQYADVPRTTWKGWVDAANAGPMAVAIATAKRAAKHLPAAPSPAYVRQKPRESRRCLDLLGEVDGLLSDAEMLRAWSTTRVAAEDGQQQEKIKAPQFFAQSITLRSNILETAAKLHQQVYDMRRMQRFYDACLEEIAAESPEAARRIIERLERLNAETGMTVDARI